MFEIACSATGALTHVTDSVYPLTKFYLTFENNGHLSFPEKHSPKPTLVQKLLSDMMKITMTNHFMCHFQSEHIPEKGIACQTRNRFATLHIKQPQLKYEED